MRTRSNRDAGFLDHTIRRRSRKKWGQYSGGTQGSAGLFVFETLSPVALFPSSNGFRAATAADGAMETVGELFHIDHAANRWRSSGLDKALRQLGGIQNGAIGSLFLSQTSHI